MAERRVIPLLLAGLHAALMLAAAPAVAGLVASLRARLAGRVGPPLGQPYQDLRRWSRKRPILPGDGSAAAAMTPFVCAGTAAVAAVLVPSFTLGMVTAPAADLIVIAGLLAASEAAAATAGLDTGTALGGVAAGRAMGLAVLTLPALLLAVFAAAVAAGSTNVDLVAGAVRDGALGLAPLGLGLAAAAIAAFAALERPQPEGAALGQGQDAFRLAYSGWHLAVWAYAGWLRSLVRLSLLATIFVPAGIAPAGAGAGDWAGGLLLWLLKIAVGAAGLAVCQAMGPLRWSRMPALVGLALLLGLLAATLLFASQRSA